jgi:polyisoprenoid-binding protein YceI
MTEATSTILTGVMGTWQLDPKTTTVEFHTTAHWGPSKVVGTVRALEGRGTVGDDGGVSGDLVLDATSIDTKIKRRDKHLRGRDFFDVSRYPTFTFTASEATPLPEGTVGIKGTLRIKDQSHPIELVATLTTPSAGRITLSGVAVIDRRQWGVVGAPMGAGLVNRVVVVAQFEQS